MRMSKIIIAAFSLACSAPLFGANLQMIGNQEMRGKLLVNGQSADLSGGISLMMSASEQDLQSGVVRLQDFNIRYNKVRQQLLTGREPRGSKTSVLGFAALPLKYGHVLKYDRRQKTISGSVSGRMDFAQLRELAPPQLQENLDIYLTPTQSAVVDVRIDLDRPIDEAQGAAGVVDLSGKITFKVSAKRLPSVEIPSYTIDNPAIRIVWRYTLLARYEVGRELCLQPVRFRATLTDTPTGDGWSFGLPGAQTQWKKGDVTFKQRAFKTVTAPSLLIASESEMGTILSQVEDDDCIEIFFPDEFSPHSLYGGGATFGSGTASAQIVSSDENAVHGIDLTHLAHELGHVLGLHHPGAGYPTAARPEVIDGSSGTLMCPSGFMNDNPDINSEENESNVHNPLLTFTFKQVSAGPDCTDSADCGPCP